MYNNIFTIFLDYLLLEKVQNWSNKFNIKDYSKILGMLEYLQASLLFAQTLAITG